MLALGRRISGEDYGRAVAVAAAARAALDELFGGSDVVVAPAAPGAAPRGLRFTGDPVFNRPWQLLGCPCIALPVQRDGAGLPLRSR